MVQVRPKRDIMRTLNEHGRNRGPSFNGGMVPYCGNKVRALRRLERILSEEDGRMMHLPNGCLILEGMTRRGCLGRYRLFCPSSIYPFWHEVWLRRLDDGRGGSAPTK